MVSSSSVLMETNRIYEGDLSHIVSFSGGKDSTAMLLLLIEHGYRIDDIVFFDTGWEFPEMIEHIKQVEDYIGRKVTVLHPKIPFSDWMLRREVVARKGENKGEVHRIGEGWPSPFRRWCTGQKISALHKYIGKNAVQYIGIAADEAKRIESKAVLKKEVRYPLIDWNLPESDCLKYCYNRGFDWGGLYEYRSRVSCFCCPLQKIGSLRTLRRVRPELWGKMLEWEIEMEKTGANQGFKGWKTVHDLDRRFACEDRQLDLFETAK